MRKRAVFMNNLSSKEMRNFTTLDQQPDEFNLKKFTSTNFANIDFFLYDSIEDILSMKESLKYSQAVFTFSFFNNKVELHDYFLKFSEVFSQIRFAFQEDISVLFFGDPKEYQDRINSSFHHFPLAQELIQFHRFEVWDTKSNFLEKILELSEYEPYRTGIPVKSSQSTSFLLITLVIILLCLGFFLVFKNTSLGERHDNVVAISGNSKEFAHKIEKEFENYKSNTELKFQEMKRDTQKESEITQRELDSCRNKAIQMEITISGKEEQLKNSQKCENDQKIHDLKELLEISENQVKNLERSLGNCNKNLNSLKKLSENKID
jgi:hypothetical protein